MSVQPSPGPSARIKLPLPTVGIAAGAEDAKYQTKYKELKRKVKQVETDNDKLHFKVLQAKRSIQRMKLERAILYERLAAIPSPNGDPLNGRGLPSTMPPLQGGPAPPPFSRSHSGYQDMSDNPHDSPNNEYSVPRDRPRIVSGSGMPAAAPSAAHTPRMHSPPRRVSGGPGHDSRHTQHIPSHPISNSRPHVSPIMHHSHSNASHGHTRSHSSSRSRSHQQQYNSGHPHQHPEGLPPVPQQQALHRSPSQEKERYMRYVHDNSLEPSRMHSLMPRFSPPPRHSHGHTRLSAGPPGREEYEREHEHERRDRDHELVDHERNHPRDLGRSRDPNSIMSPPLVHRSRQSYDRGNNDYPEPHGSSRMRDEPAYYDAPPAASGGYLPHSRSGSPVSGSGSGNGVGGADASRPDSRHYYDPQERSRGYKLRPVNPPNEEMDFVHEDGRSRDRGVFEVSRKRARNDMEGDDDAGDYQSGRPTEDRGKRYHREHHRTIDNQDDGRMGPP